MEPVEDLRALGMTANRWCLRAGQWCRRGEAAAAGTISPMKACGGAAGEYANGPGHRAGSRARQRAPGQQCRSYDVARIRSGISGPGRRDVSDRSTLRQEFQATLASQARLGGQVER